MISVWRIDFFLWLGPANPTTSSEWLLPAPSRHFHPSHPLANVSPAATASAARFCAGRARTSAFVMPKPFPCRRPPASTAIASSIRWAVARLRPSPRPSSPRLRLLRSHQQQQPFSSTSCAFLAQPYYNSLEDELWFAPSPASLFSSTRGQGGPVPDGLNGGASGDHKPPDERVLKLGKSE